MMTSTCWLTLAELEVKTPAQAAIHLFADGDFSCFVTRFTGTFTQPWKLPDGTIIEPTGRSSDVLYSTAARWEDGRIAEEYLFWDSATFRGQVGLA